MTPEGADDDLIGRVVGHYRIDARVGAGGMGDVYRAHDRKLERPVALKWLPRVMAGDADRLRRFHAEAKAASSLNHPHILVVHDFGDEDGVPFMVTEFVEGESLRARLARGSIPLAQAVEIGAQVADALAAAHARGIVHRDVKPDNIMLRPDGHVKVLDFGLAKVSAPAIDDMTMAASTLPGVVFGTPRYMSPEQLRGSAVDARSDVWSLGVTLYEMVAGRQPFPDTTAADLVGAILHSEPSLEPLGVAGPLIAKALRKAPLDRYQDAHDLMVELTALKRRLELPESGDDRPQRTTVTASHNFPFQVTRFVGREDDIERVCSALRESRLVTLAGAGGVGKTRLALEVGTAVIDRFADGAWLVNLAPLSDPALVAATVADALGVREQPGRPIADAVCDYLQSRRLLIVLDNCEHLMDACATLVQRLLESCAAVSVLATSRETLNLPGEHVWRLRSLSMPEAGDDRLASVSATESVQLFLQRARAVRPGFELTTESLASVVQICRRLDGLPLAIELAAARVSVMSTIEIAARLDDRFRLLTGGSRMAVPRQRTLEAAVSWSYDLLPPAERELFCRLSVFAGGWTLSAAECVCADEQLEREDIADHLAHLVERSMVAADQERDGRTRYRMLETFRQFGRNQLIARGEMTDVRNAHLAWMVRLADPAEAGSRPNVAAELDNLRAALEWAYETGSYEAGLRIMSSPPIGHFSEWTRMLTLLLPFIDRVPVDVQATVLHSAGGLAFMIGNWSWGVELMRGSAAANATAGNPMRRSMSLTYLGACQWGLGDLDAAIASVEAGIAVARDAHDIKALARGLMIRTWLETELDLDRAEALAAETESAAATLENVFDLGHCREVQGYIQCLKGRVDEGAKVLAAALAIFKDIQINCGSHVLESAATWAVIAGRLELGAEFLGSAQRIRKETGDKPRPWEHAVQNRWLPKIGASLDAEVFHAALRRGLERSWAEALEYAETTLRESEIDRDDLVHVD